MSHNLLFMRYVKGESAPYDLEKLRAILLKHGAEIDSPQDAGDGVMTSLVMFPCNDDGDDISSDESAIFFESAGVVEFAIGRPQYGERLKALCFDLLQGLPICMHPDFGEEVHAVQMSAEHLPEELLETCDGGVKFIKGPNELW